MPTVVLCSDEFGPLGRAEADVLGLGGLPLVAIPHPLADNAPLLVQAKGVAIIDEVRTALTSDAAEVAEAHRGRFRHLTQKRLEGGMVCTDEVCAIDLAMPQAGVGGGA